MYLAHRSTQDMARLTNERDSLPVFIRRCLDWLRDQNAMGPSQEYRFAFMLSKQLTFACKSAWDMVVYKPTSRTFQDVSPNFNLHKDDVNLPADLLAIAAAVGQSELIQRVVDAFGCQWLWVVSYAYGYPLSAAAGGNHSVVVDYLVNDFETNYRMRPSKQYETAFKNAIDVALLRGHSKVATQLLQVYHHRFPAVPKSLYQKWLVKGAVDPDVYQVLSTLRTDVAVREHIVAFEVVCKSGSKSGVESFLAQGRVGLDQPYLEGKLLRCPLYVAVDVGKPGPVQALLELGAHPDGVPTSRPRDSPLWLAFQRQDLDIVDLLVSWGADVVPTFYLWLLSDIEFRDEHRALGLHVAQVHEQRTALFDAFMLGHNQL
jgi:hypothetical protein